MYETIDPLRHNDRQEKSTFWIHVLHICQSADCFFLPSSQGMSYSMHSIQNCHQILFLERMLSFSLNPRNYRWVSSRMWESFIAMDFKCIPTAFVVVIFHVDINLPHCTVLLCGPTCQTDASNCRSELPRSHEPEGVEAVPHTHLSCFPTG